MRYACRLICCPACLSHDCPLPPALPLLLLPVDLQLAPVKNLVDNAASVSCGVDFTAWLTKTGQVGSGGTVTTCTQKAC